MLETARGGILRRGLGYDWSDISVLTNISDDHVGQDGIKSVEDVVFIKSLVAERVKEGGTLILNAGDEHLAKLMESERVNKIPKKVVYLPPMKTIRWSELICRVGERPTSRRTRR